MHQATDQATNQTSRAKSSWRSASKAGARWLSGCMRRMSTRTVTSAHGLSPRVRENSLEKSLASMVVASSPAISTRTLSRAVWLRSSRWVVLRRFRLTTRRPVLKAARLVGLAAQTTHSVDGRAWRRPIHRALRITHTVSMALMGLMSPLASHRARRSLTQHAGGRDAWRRRCIATRWRRIATNDLPAIDHRTASRFGARSVCTRPG